MPVRARSRSSISAMTCLPERLIVRSSSSSRIDAVAGEAAVARERRRLVDQRRLDRVAHVGEIVELGDQRADERRLQLARARCVTRGIDGQRLLQADQIARPGGAERGARDQPLEILHRLAACRGTCRARWSGTRAPRPRRADRESARARRSGRSSHARSSRLPIDVTVRSISSSSDPVAAAFRALDDLEVLQRGRIDEQARRRAAGRRSRGRARGRPSASSRRCWTSAPAAATAAGRPSRPKPSRPAARS